MYCIRICFMNAHLKWMWILKNVSTFCHQRSHDTVWAWRDDEPIMCPRVGETHWWIHPRWIIGRRSLSYRPCLLWSQRVYVRIIQTKHQLFKYLYFLLNKIENVTLPLTSHWASQLKPMLPESLILISSLSFLLMEWWGHTNEDWITAHALSQLLVCWCFLVSHSNINQCVQQFESESVREAGEAITILTWQSAQQQGYSSRSFGAPLRNCSWENPL